MQDLNLNSHVKGWLQTRANRPRSPGFHPSEATRVCPVLEYFFNKADDDITSGDSEKINTALDFKRDIILSKRIGGAALHMEFEIGDAIHESVQFYLGVIGYLWGNWRCRSCGFTTEKHFMPRTKLIDILGRDTVDCAPCNICNGANIAYDHPWVYIEPSINNEKLAVEHNISGHMDGEIRRWEAGELVRYVLEIKSINSKGFASNLPKKEHITQASIYGAVMGIKNIHFVYVNKDKVSEWNEFIVPVDLSEFENVLTKAKTIKEHKILTVPPLHARVCETIDDTRAYSCPARFKCFGGKT